MKIIAYDTTKNNAVINNKKIQLQVHDLATHGFEYLWVKTNENGAFDLDDEKYGNHRLSTSIMNSGFTPWKKAQDGAVLKIDTQAYAREQAKNVKHVMIREALMGRSERGNDGKEDNEREPSSLRP